MGDCAALLRRTAGYYLNKKYYPCDDGCCTSSRSGRCRRGRDRGRAPPPPARRAGGGWGKKAGVGPCDAEYALKLELLRKKAGVDAAFFELGHLAADSADTLAASVDAKAIGDAFQT